MQFPNAAPAAASAAPAVPAKTRRPLMTLANVVRGKRVRPPKVLLYGPQKIGKSTFASGAPSPIFIGADDGTDHLDIARLPPPRDLRDVFEAIELVRANAEGEGWKTLVVDPVNWLEPLVHRAVTGDLSVSLATYGRGYGEGNDTAMAHWRKLLAALERVYLRGLGIVLLAHSRVKRYEPPDAPAFDKYEVDMGAKPAGLLQQWVDAVLIAKRDIRVLKTDKQAKAKAYSDGAVYMHAEWSPAFDAGNRYSLPAVMPLGWATFADEREAGVERADRQRASIRELAARLGEDVAAKVDAYLLDPTISLVEIENKLVAKLDALEAARASEEEKPEGAPATTGAPDEYEPHATDNDTDNEGDIES